MRRNKIWMIGLIILLSACGGKEKTTQPPDVNDTPSSAIVQKVVGLLASELNVESDDIIVKSAEPIDWPNACLGIEKPGEMCAEVITPGYKVTLSFNNQDYIYHTNSDGSLVLPEIDTQSQLDPFVPDSPEAVLQAKIFLSEELNVKPAVIKTISYEARDWPDGCLGISEPNVSCIQVITPGYLVTLECNETIYNLRTNDDGSLIKIDTTRPEPGTSDS